MWPRGAAGTEQHTRFTFSGYSPKWRKGGDNLLNKVAIFFSLFFFSLPNLVALYNYGRTPSLWSVLQVSFIWFTPAGTQRNHPPLVSWRPLPSPYRTTTLRRKRTVCPWVTTTSGSSAWTSTSCPGRNWAAWCTSSSHGSPRCATPTPRRSKSILKCWSRPRCVSWSDMLWPACARSPAIRTVSRDLMLATYES